MLLPPRPRTLTAWMLIGVSGFGLSAETTNVIVSYEYSVKISYHPLRVFNGQACPDYYKYEIFSGLCERLWGLEQLVDYYVTSNSRPIDRQLITEKLIDLGHNHDGTEGCSQVQRVQIADPNGHFTDHMLWIVRDHPPTKPIFKRCGQVLYANGRPLVVNIIEFRIDPRTTPGGTLLISALEVNNPKAVTLIEYFRKREQKRIP